MAKYNDPKRLQEFERRAKELVAQMTLEEKASQLTYNAKAIPRLGIPEYNWWNEALHGVARAGTATVFPQAIGLAAIFDADYMHRIAGVISTEARAKYNANSKRNDRDIYKGLTFWSPNINIFRDPRWGRGHETYGEDPTLTAKLGVAFINGLQGDGEYMKVAACAKHYAVHSGPESLRHEFNAEVSQYDLWDTYLPAFEACVTEAGVESVMGAYNRTNGEPCCGSETLLVDILREKWGFQGHVVSDCWALLDFHEDHKVTKTMTESAALAMKNGCDLNCGVVYLHILAALEEGLLEEADIDRAVIRLMTTRMKLGMFDENVEYDQIPYEENDSPAHNRLALEAAEKSMVLLKNDGLLPLNRKNIKTIAVIGPNADSREILIGNYNGTPSNPITILNGIQNEVGDTIRVLYSEGCNLFHERPENKQTWSGVRMAEAVAAAECADLVILSVGLDGRIEGEEGDAQSEYGDGDKSSLLLPGIQNDLIQRVAATGKPCILLLSSGSAIDLCWAQECENIHAILQTWYPGGQGGKAVAKVLFGEVSPAGRLPVTFYRHTEDLPDFCDYSMDNRTYRYFKGTPLYPFGYGLSYTNFAYSDLKLSASKIAAGEIVIATVTVTNIGDVDSDEVVECYIKDLEASTKTPLISLCDFKRIYLKKGESAQVELTIAPNAMRIVEADGSRRIEPGTFRISVGSSAPDARSAELLGRAPLTAEFDVTTA